MDIVHPILQWHKDIHQEPLQLLLIVLFPSMLHESIVEPMDHIFREEELFSQTKNSIYTFPQDLNTKFHLVHPLQINNHQVQQHQHLFDMNLLVLFHYSIDWFEDQI
jgi:hypothetical protein